MRANDLAHGGRRVDLLTPGASYAGVYLPLHGAHQGDNAAAALAGAEAFFGAPLPRTWSRRRSGAPAPGRLEVVARDPLCILDGAHNPAGRRRPPPPAGRRSPSGAGKSWWSACSPGGIRSRC